MSTPKKSALSKTAKIKSTANPESNEKVSKRRSSSIAKAQKSANVYTKSLFLKVNL